MVLSWKVITELIKQGKIRVEPEPELKEVGIKIHLGGRFGRNKGTLMRSEGFYLAQGKFVIAESKEHITLPGNLTGMYDTYVGMAGQGIITHMGSMFVDPGFSGHIQLEIFNCSDVSIDLREGTRVGHLVLLPVIEEIPL